LYGALAVISGGQVRDGRVLLGWTVRELAHKANVGIFTINQIERAGHSRYPGLATVEATLKAAGIVFLDGAAPACVGRLIKNRTRYREPGGRG
jgi:transcriptional regulator with XRE-family HTH domain